MDKPIIYGVPESHPSIIVNLAIETVERNLLTFRKFKTPSVKDGIRNYDEVTKRFFRKSAYYKTLYGDSGTSELWEQLVSAIDALPIVTAIKEKSLHDINYARSIMEEEQTLVGSIKPEILYMEGERRSYKGIAGSVIHVAESGGARTVYLDEDSGVYEWLSTYATKYNVDFTNSQDFKDLQKKREERWIQRIKRNLPRNKAVMIVGHDHLNRDNKDYPFLGRVPEMLERTGINFEVLNDLRKAS
ncbi:MAG: hypothetical protein HYT71_01575 [Candidatus Aenigmarchaeota archaeon]|nr:hypothetical protein [Candidatus Aenigmarchaeota archaeon]